MLFIRHGQQEAEDGTISRLSPLSERGHKQASALATELGTGPRLGAVYSSPLPRAVATAETICGPCLLIPIIDPRLAEFELGTRSIDQIADRSDLLVWRPQDTGKDGISLYAFSRRIANFCDEIAARHAGERVAIVSHSGTIDAAVRWALSIDPGCPWQHEVEVQHASITEVEFWPRGRIVGGAPRYAVLRRLNHTAHLGDLLSDL